MVLTVPIGLWSGRNVNCKCTCFGRIESNLDNVEYWIYATFESGQIFIWKVSDQNIIHKSVLIQDSDASPIVSTSSYGKNHLATLSLSGLIQFWHVPSGRVVFSIQASDRLGGLVTLSETLIAAFGELSEVLVFSTKTGKREFSLGCRLYPDWITCAVSINVPDLSVLLGITAGGTLKVWRVSTEHQQSLEEPLWEEESKQIRSCEHPIVLKLRSEYALVVCKKSFYILDSSDFSSISYQSIDSDCLVDGFFLQGSSNFAIVSENKALNLSYFTIYTTANLKPQSADDQSPQLIWRTSAPLHSNFQLSGKRLHSIAPSLEISTYVAQEDSLIEIAKTASCSGVEGELDVFCTNDSYITAVCFVEEKDTLIFGRSDGHLVIAPAIPSFAKCVFDINEDVDVFTSAVANYAEITCLMYPYQHNTASYDDDVFFVGSADFSVSAWSLTHKQKLVEFHNHMAPLLSLTISPIKVGKSAGTAVSIDVDGGICVLHPKTHQCLLSDPGFGQAIIDVAWTNDGYLIVTREDGSCKTWDAYSMALERETSSSQANEIQSTAELYPHDKPPARRQQLIFVQPMFLDQLDSPPILKCLSFHFDVEKMVQNIIQHYRLNQTSNKKMPSRQASEDKSQPNLTNTLKTTGMQLFSSVQSKIRESRSGRQSPATPTSPKSPQQQATSPSKLSLSSAPSLDTSESAILGPQSLAFGRILIMTLHAWGLQPSLDELLVTMISFARPKKSLIFGVRRQSCCVFFFPEEPDNFNEHWNISKDLTNLHLMSIGSLCNSLMNLSEEFLGDGRQCWSGLVTLHCALLSDLLEKYTPLLWKHWRFAGLIVCKKFAKRDKAFFLIN
ncbi:Oidioi.mRNA.OKI2018_I69.PAR.g12424.t1.cds [Oikopleura dioica]|uniref:Oidioi.mRNA.OKI2018_I69.PAR.g12424.t1.cds n=1 Tax=Oikopleura dioica TaxID=34765 RepID=A0ABN7S4W0_OIKDI|nr:Oidioi.mRNA.OKI2018_I69.PAR.g12424.t1.cds [Oikopleura dioica]